MKELEMERWYEVCWHPEGKVVTAAPLENDEYSGKLHLVEEPDIPFANEPIPYSDCSERGC